MKKLLLVLGVLSAAVLAFGAVGFAYAHNQNPPDSDTPYGPGMMGGGYGYGGGWMGAGYGHGRGGMMGWGYQNGPMHEAMVSALADELGLSVEEIETRHENGETLWEIAAAQGLSADEIQAVMFSAHDIALEEAVASGWLTEEQAQWMNEHMDQRWSGEYSGFSGHCGGGGWFDPSGGQAAP